MNPVTDTPAGIPRGRGRPRDPASDETITSAVLEVLAEEGYDGMTVDAVAERAGVGRATVYRRWSSKADMVIGALSRRSFATVRDPATGDFRADLESMLAQILTSMSRECGVIQVLQIEVRRHPELGDAFRRDFLQDRREMLRGVLARGVDSGDLAPDADLDTLTDIGPALIWFYLTAHGAMPAVDLPRRVSDVIVGCHIGS